MGNSINHCFGRAAIAVVCLAATSPHAQPWKPTRTIEITVSSGAGGAADREARELQKHLQKLPGMPAITVNNRPGGGGAIAWLSLNQHQGDAQKAYDNFIAKLRAAGYTVLTTPQSANVLSRVLSSISSAGNIQRSSGEYAFTVDRDAYTAGAMSGIVRFNAEVAQAAAEAKLN